MNVFVMNTGRCGSSTFIMACRHITNYTSGHESRRRMIGKDRLAYPENHIEADNRLSWILGRLENAYGNNACYVHLKRDVEATARSFTRRYSSGIIKAYRRGVLMGLPRGTDPMRVATDYCDTITSNIEMYLRDKDRKMEFRIEHARNDFRLFWKLIGAEGDLEAALAEFDTRHNASKPKLSLPRLFRKLAAFAAEFPGRIKGR